VCASVRMSEKESECDCVRVCKNKILAPPNEGDTYTITGVVILTAAK